MPFIVLSVFHAANGRDRTFVHGVFQCYDKAQKTVEKVEKDPSYILQEGYQLSREDRGISVYVCDIPMEVHVNEFIPTFV